MYIEDKRLTEDTILSKLSAMVSDYVEKKYGIHFTVFFEEGETPNLCCMRLINSNSNYLFGYSKGSLCSKALIDDVETLPEVVAIRTRNSMVKYSKKARRRFGIPKQTLRSRR